MSPTPMDIVGAPDDADVQRALTFFLENSQRFDPDVRLDSLDVLRTERRRSCVRRTLCAAARLDRDPGVRLKALEALQGFEQDPPSAAPFWTRWRATAIPACGWRRSTSSAVPSDPATHTSPATRKPWTSCATACATTPAWKSASKAPPPWAS